MKKAKLGFIKKALCAGLVVFHAITFSGVNAFAGDGWNIVDANGNNVGGDVFGGQSYTVTNGNIGAGETVNINILNENGIADPSARAIFNFNDGAATSWAGILNLIGTAAFVNTFGFDIAQSFQANISGGAVVSSLQINQQAFLDNGLASLSRGLNDTAFINNEGTFNLVNGSFLALVASAVRNAGVIQGEGSRIALVAGDKVTLPIDNFLGLQVTEEVEAPVYDKDGNRVKDGILNSGSIVADGGIAILSARAADNVFDKIVNTSGLIQANTLSEKKGRIFLDGGDQGIVSVSGSLLAQGDQVGESGGLVEVYGEKVGLFGGSTVDVSGYAHGGTALIGGDYQGLTSFRNARAVYVDPFAVVKADSLLEGNGGKVIVFADGSARVHGILSARGGVLSGDGGLIETSGKEFLDIAGLSVDASAPRGSAGTWALDPFNVNIVAGLLVDNGTFAGGAFDPTGNDSRIGADNISAALDAGNNVVISTGAAGAQNGDIFFEIGAAIKKTVNTGSVTLTLNAARDIFQTSTGGSIVSVGAGILNVVMTAGRNVGLGSTIKTEGGTLNVTANGNIGFTDLPDIDLGGGSASFNADSDFNGSGSFQILSNFTKFNSNNGNVDIVAADFSNTLGSQFSTGTGALSINSSIGGSSIGLGDSSVGDFKITNTDLIGVTAGSLSIGTPSSGDITANNFQLNGITPTLTLRGRSINAEFSDLNPEISVTNLGFQTTEASSFDVQVDTLAGALNAFAPGGELFIRDTNGGVTVGNVGGISGLSNRGGGNLTLAALGVDSDITVDQDVFATDGNGFARLIAGDDINIQSVRSVFATGQGDAFLFAGVEFSDGSLAFDGSTNADINMSAESSVKTTDGDVNLNAFRNVNLALADANSNGDAVLGDVNINTINGGIVDANGSALNAKGDGFNLRTQNGIGSSDALETRVSEVDLINTASGDVQILEVAAGGPLSLNRAFQQGAGKLNVTTESGSIDINFGGFGVTSTSGEINLLAQGAVSDVIINNNVTSGSGKIDLEASRDVNFNFGDLRSTSGEIEVTAGRDINMQDGRVADAGSGIIDFDAVRNIGIASLKTTNNTSDAVHVVSTAGAIFDAGDTDFNIQTGGNGTALLVADTGIGNETSPLGALETQIGKLAAKTAAGDIRIDNQGIPGFDFVISGAVDPVAGSVQGLTILDTPVQRDPGSTIEVTNTGSLFRVSQEVNNFDGGEINLLAADNQLVIESNLLAAGGQGDINLGAAGNLTFGAGTTTRAQGAGNVTAVSGEDINMTGNAEIGTESGDVNLLAVRDVNVGFVSADSNNDGLKGNVNILAGRDIIDSDNSDLLNIVGQTANLLAGRNVGEPGDPIEFDVDNLNVNAGGSIFARDLGDTNLNAVSTNGSIDFGATGDINLGLASAPNGTVTLNAGGSINGPGSVIGQAINLLAGGTIGVPSAVNAQLTGPGPVSVSAGSQANGLSVQLIGNFGVDQLNLLNNPPGLVILNGFAVGGQLFNGLISSTSNALYAPPLAKNDGNGNFDPRHLPADFPGRVSSLLPLFNGFEIDVTSLDRIFGTLSRQSGIPGLQPVVPIPTNAIPSGTPGVAAQQ